MAADENGVLLLARALLIGIAFLACSISLPGFMLVLVRYYSVKKDATNQARAILFGPYVWALRDQYKDRQAGIQGLARALLLIAVISAAIMLVSI